MLSEHCDWHSDQWTCALSLFAKLLLQAVIWMIFACEINRYIFELDLFEFSHLWAEMLSSSKVANANSVFQFTIFCCFEHVWDIRQNLADMNFMILSPHPITGWWVASWYALPKAMSTQIFVDSDFASKWKPCLNASIMPFEPLSKHIHV